MMMESRRVLITDEDRGPIVNIATWIALVVMCIIVSMKTISRWATIHKLQRDDFYIIVAMVLHPLIPSWIRTRLINTRSIVNHCWSVHCCCRTSQIRPWKTYLDLDERTDWWLSNGNFSVYTPIGRVRSELVQTTYISQILYAPSICGARVALLQFMLALAPDRLRRRLILGSMVFCMLWALIATLCVVLQCNTPRTWAIVFGQCFNQVCLHWDIEIGQAIWDTNCLSRSDSGPQTWYLTR